ncbi:MAG: nucleoside-diphosphate sugar epimerase, partial [Deltaproteobacteria bacterium]|nr:nucleoside-diphosphate sugar epimerase [Deltaproteobacteria bacterium]
DCVEALFTVRNNMPKVFDIYNLGAYEYCTVNDSIGWITALMGLKPTLEYAGGIRGWVGDNPFIFLETKKIRSLGWNNKLSIKQAVEQTVRWLLDNHLNLK